MGTRTSYPHGTFSFCDLVTSDPRAAQVFYGELFDWRFEDTPAPGGVTYSLAYLGGDVVAALFGLTHDMKAREIPPHFQSYVTVHDIDSLAERAKRHGGEVLDAPFDISDAGRLATIRDPSGGVLQLWQPNESIGATRVNDPGCLVWNELNTRDLPAAKAFFTDLFGWSYAEEGHYTTILNGGRPNGGMLDITGKVPDWVPTHWNVYFSVLDLEDALGKVAVLGGAVHVPPTPITAGTFAVVADPQGATFSLIHALKVDD